MSGRAIFALTLGVFGAGAGCVGAEAAIGAEATAAESAPAQPDTLLGIGVWADAPLTGRDLGASAERWWQLAQAEDRRVQGEGDARRLTDALLDPAPAVRRAAVRAAGRLESPDWIERIEPLLFDIDSQVRIEAANALAQAVFRGAGGVDLAEAHLLAALARAQAATPDLAFGGSVARALGRLRYPAPEFAAAAPRLAEALAGFAHWVEQVALQVPNEGAPEVEAARLGLARGALFFLRNPATRGLGPPRDRLLAALDALLSEPIGASDPVRRAAAAARVGATGTPPETLTQLLADPDEEVRRLGVSAISAARSATGGAEGAEWMAEALFGDPAPTVRAEAVRAWVRTRGWASPSGWAPMAALAQGDASDLVAMLALDALGSVGAAQLGGTSAAPALDPALISVLEAVIASAPDRPIYAWHRPLRALTVLARLDPLRGWAHLASDTALGAPSGTAFTPVWAHPNPFARAQAARVLQSVFEVDPAGVEAQLRNLAVTDTGDPLDAVVRDAALTALQARIGRAADPLLRDALSATDPGLVRTAARLLAGSPPEPQLTAALVASLERFSGVDGTRPRATDRDTRVALRDRLREQAPDAPDALDALERFGEEPSDDAFEGAPFPSLAHLQDLEGRVLVLEIEGAGVLEVQLLPFEAPTTAARLAALAASGALDGRTLHRSVPNFVVQGGSPFGNEYAGNGSYTRDEVGRIGHWKGTLGVSTRGRDTGDGQLFVNTVDNLRLDHDYTVLGFLVGGLEAAEAIQEGARILRAGVR